MKAVVQRVTSSAVVVDGETMGKIGKGYNVLLGVFPDDTKKDAEILAAKSKSAGNTAKLKAIGALKAIEASPADKGCSSSVSTLGVSGLALAIGAIVVALKKKEQ